MSQTHVILLVHIVFSTKNRVDLITREVEEELFAYIGGIVRNSNCVLIAAGGTANHIHLLVSLNKSVLLPRLIGDIKRSSSMWIKTKDGMLKRFAWQDGYSAFSVGHTQIQDVKRYIARQKEHHSIMVFEDEMRGFYRKYEISYDEQYIWD